MRPDLFTIGPFAVSAYPLMIALGACGAIALTLLELRRRRLAPRPYLVISLVGLAAGLVGARLMNCVVCYDRYRDAPV